MGCGRIHFNAVCIVVSDYISCKFHNCQLHTEAEAEEWDLVFAGKFDRGDHAFDTAVTKTARNNNAVCITECFFYIGRCYQLGIHPLDIYGCVNKNTAVL